MNICSKTKIEVFNSSTYAKLALFSFLCPRFALLPTLIPSCRDHSVFQNLPMMYWTTDESSMWRLLHRWSAIFVVDILYLSPVQNWVLVTSSYSATYSHCQSPPQQRPRTMTQMMLYLWMFWWIFLTRLWADNDYELCECCGSMTAKWQLLWVHTHPILAMPPRLHNSMSIWTTISKSLSVSSIS